MREPRFVDIDLAVTTLLVKLIQLEKLQNLAAQTEFLICATIQ